MSDVSQGVGVVARHLLPFYGAQRKAPRLGKIPLGQLTSANVYSNEWREREAAIKNKSERIICGEEWGTMGLLHLSRGVGLLSL